MMVEMGFFAGKLNSDVIGDPLEFEIVLPAARPVSRCPASRVGPHISRLPEVPLLLDNEAHL